VTFLLLLQKSKTSGSKLQSVHTDFNPMDVTLQQLESNLQKEHGKWLANEEDQMRQKSSESWMFIGDKNTIFFFSFSFCCQN